MGTKRWEGGGGECWDGRGWTWTWRSSSRRRPPDYTIGPHRARDPDSTAAAGLVAVMAKGAGRPVQRVPGTGYRRTAFSAHCVFFWGGGPPIVTFRCFVCPSGMYECLVLAGALQSVCRRATSSTPQGSPSEWPWPLVTGVLFGTKGDHDAMGLRAGMVPDAQGYLGIMTGRRPTEHGRRVWTSWRGRDRQR